MTERHKRRRWRGDPYSYTGRWPPPSPAKTALLEDSALSRPRGGGLEYGHYLIPRTNDVRPDATRVATLVKALVDAGYLAATGTPAFQRLKFTDSIWSEAAAKTGATYLSNRVDFKGVPVPLDDATTQALAQGDYRLLFPIRTAWTAGLKLPLDQSAPARRGEDGPGYDIEFHSANDYVHLTSELIGTFPTVDPATRPVPCKVSGTNLRYAAERVDNMFDRLGDRIRHTCPTCSTIFRPQERPVRVLDGWTGTPAIVQGGATYRFAVVIDCGTSIPEQRPSATPEFKALCERVLATPLYEIGTSY
jgi:hypothetical protein